MGLGCAVLFVGEQDWRAMGGATTDTAAGASPRCSSDYLTADRGTEHADAAAAAAAADGFPAGTVIFLDVERVSRVSPELESYVRAWVARLLANGRFVPGLYAHDVNVELLYAAVADEYARTQPGARPPLWVARTAGFDVKSAPRESGYGAAVLWQGRLDTSETWGGRSLLIDVNVADSMDPSRGR
jgi:hypothetical protein